MKTTILAYVIALGGVAMIAFGLRGRYILIRERVDPPPLKWSDLRYAFDIQEDCNGKEAIQA